MFGSTSGMASEGMNSTLHTRDAKKGQGASNRAFVSDPKMDAMLEQAESTFDDAKREELTTQAVRYAMQQRLVLPLFFVKASWGVRQDLTLEPRADQYTMATTVRKVGS